MIAGVTLDSVSRNCGNEGRLERERCGEVERWGTNKTLFTAELCIRAGGVSG